MLRPCACSKACAMLHLQKLQTQTSKKGTWQQKALSNVQCQASDRPGHAAGVWPAAAAAAAAWSQLPA